MTTITQNGEKSKEIQISLQRFCKMFGVYKLLARFGAEKAKGIPFRELFDFIISLVFSGKNLFQSIQSGTATVSKDSVYRFLNNTKIHWENILWHLSTSVIMRVRKLTSDDRLTAIVVDDSPFSRGRSRKVELLSKLHDHVSHKFFMGFQMLTLGFTDGVSFIPFAAQLMASEKTENKADSFDCRTIAARRRKNATKSKLDVLYSLLKTAKSRHIPAKHVLFDSWFSNPITLLKIKEIGFFCVAMLKKNKTKYLFNGENLSINQIYNSVKKRPGKSKYLASVLVTVVHKDTDKSAFARIVFVRDKGNRKKWCAIISTDISLSEEEIIQLYGKRWDIEVFFKMCKSYLKLAKEFEGRSFDMMTAHTTIVFIRYICLAWQKRENQDDRCFGELFFLICGELEDISFANALETLLLALVEALTDALFLNDSQIAVLLDCFFAKLPEIYLNCLIGVCES
jgi:hypothetical protein